MGTETLNDAVAAALNGPGSQTKNQPQPRAVLGKPALRTLKASISDDEHLLHSRPSSGPVFSGTASPADGASGGGDSDSDNSDVGRGIKPASHSSQPATPRKGSQSMKSPMLLQGFDEDGAPLESPRSPGYGTLSDSTSLSANISFNEDGEPVSAKAGAFSFFSLLVIGFFWVSGGCYGNEELFAAAPPGVVLLASFWHPSSMPCLSRSSPLSWLQPCLTTVDRSE